MPEKQGEYQNKWLKKLMNVFLHYAQSIKYCPAVLMILLIKADVNFFQGRVYLSFLADHINSFINPYLYTQKNEGTDSQLYYKK